LFVASAAVEKALIEFVPIESESAACIYSSWKLATRSDVRQLITVHGIGHTELDGVPVAYIAIDLPDDDVGEILATRPLDADEARAVASSTAEALHSLHQQDLRHGALTPANLFIVNNEVKLSVDTLAAADRAARHAEIRDLGALVVRSFHPAATEDRLEDLAQTLPASLREIALGCLAPDDRQWTTGRVLDTLSGASDLVRNEDVPEARERRSVGRSFSRRWWALPVAGAATLAAVFAFREQPAPRSTPSEPPATVATAPVLKPSPIDKPPPFEKASAKDKPAPVPRASAPRFVPAEADRMRTSPGSTQGSWAVIAATYRNFDAAQNRANALQKKSPGLRPQVYPPAGRGNAYYVILGSGLTRKEAERLLRTARQKGAPSDSYVRKLNEV
jgi:hypothetical protein